MVSITATCDECGMSDTLPVLQLHSCQIQQQGGRCEDYPACGHTDGDGCQTRLEHTMDYWTEMYSKYPDAMDAYDWDAYH
jgi:hypothetical protein